eukprot:2241315-Pleurochrysis_carterae.AAC.1
MSQQEERSPPEMSQDGSTPTNISDVQNTPSAPPSLPASTPRELETPASARAQSVRSRLSGSSPALSLSSTPRGSDRSRSSPSVGRSDLGSFSAYNPNRRGMDQGGSPDDGSDGNDPSQGPRASIWGTNINAERTQNRIYEFFKHFRLSESSAGDEPFYLDYLEQLIAAQEDFVNLDFKHLQSFDEGLYKQVVSYPSEVVPMVDMVLGKLIEELFPDAGPYRVMVRPFNLPKENKLRELDPSDIDKLVSIKGMVTRTSQVIPDLKVAFFECSECAASKEVAVDRGQIAEPQQCDETTCQAKNSFHVIHNRCHFTDKQIVRLQEAPEDMPEGETPQTVSMCVWDKMVDVAKPGDRVEVTGVYRAVAVRSNPRHRTVRSLYKTYVDILHVRKLDKGKLRTEADEDATNETRSACQVKRTWRSLFLARTPLVARSNALARAPASCAARALLRAVGVTLRAVRLANARPKAKSAPKRRARTVPRHICALSLRHTRAQESNELNATSEERVARLKELSRSPDLYEKLAQALAPSVWEMGDIKKGVLLQLFGATNKQIDKEAAVGPLAREPRLELFLSVYAPRLQPSESPLPFPTSPALSALSAAHPRC